MLDKSGDLADPIETQCDTRDEMKEWSLIGEIESLYVSVKSESAEFETESKDSLPELKPVDRLLGDTKLKYF